MAAASLSSERNTVFEPLGNKARGSFCFIADWRKRKEEGGSDRKSLNSNKLYGCNWIVRSKVTAASFYRAKQKLAKLHSAACSLLVRVTTAVNNCNHT